MPEGIVLSQPTRVTPVLLSGGSGTRLWPLSREAYPKQFLPLLGEKSLIQQTAGRVSNPDIYGPPTVVCGDYQRFFVADQLNGIGATIILEAVARNTAFPVAVAALNVASTDPQGVLLILPADHRIVGQEEFDRAVTVAADAARRGHIVTFGIRPTWPETGYGYILPGDRLREPDGVDAIACFVEKPDRDCASRFVEDGRYLWNSGIFVASAATLIEQIGALAPATLDAAREAHAHAVRDLDFLRLDQAASIHAPDISFDVAVMEKAECAAVVTAGFSWSDIGSWQSFWMIQEHDGQGNSTTGNVVCEGVENSYLHSEGPLVAAVGLRDVVAVATNDAVLIAHRNRVQDVKTLVARLKKEQRREAVEHRRSYRPWGFFESVTVGDRFQVKILCVKPGAKLSLQSHNHRAEHWVCVKGTALVTIDGQERMLRENESTYVPLGAVHRLANPGKIELQIIEIQTGAYLGEDDIVRYEDIYARVRPAAASATTVSAGG